MKFINNKKVMMHNPTISLCMIVKNEEKFLPVCLNSIKDYVDEIILVDTGSTDRTVEIAKEYGAKIYHHPWENSFSKARNYSLKYATCDWILWLDADEEIESGDAHKLREVIKGDVVNVIYFPLYSVFDKGKNLAVANTGKIFRNRQGFYFEGRIHNTLKFSGAVKNVNIKIHHHGYNQDEEQMEKKFIRTTTLLKEQIRENPENPVPHHYLATSYLERKKNDECLREGLEAVRLYELQDSKAQTRLLNYFTVSAAFLHKKDLDNAELYSRKALDFYPDYIDAYSLISSIYFFRKDYSKCIEYTKKYLQLLKSIETDPGKSLLIPFNTLSHGWMARSRLAICCYEGDMENEGNQALKEAINSTDDKWKPYYIIGKHFFEQKNFKGAEKFFMDGLKEDPLNKNLLYNIADTYENLRMFDKAIIYLKKILEIFPDNISTHYGLGLLLLKDKQYNEAIKSFKLVTDNDPQHTGAFFSMGNAYERIGSLSSDKTSYAKAKECFLNALKLDKTSIGALLALGKIYIYLNELDKCVVCCGELLKILGLPGNVTIENVTKLSFLYINIGATLQSQRKVLLANAAYEIAGFLNPETRKNNSNRAVHSGTEDVKKKFETF